MASANRLSELDAICDRLRQRAARHRRRDYRVPALWSCWGYADARRVGRSEIAVNPYAFILDAIEREILPRRQRRRLAGRGLSRVERVRKVSTTTVAVPGRGRRRAGDWLRTASIYGLFVRTTTAWDHDGDGYLSSSRFTETGTFLKSILLLPLLRRMGVTAIYMLPVTKHSNLYRKGELGCPYSAKNFFELEPSLHDRLLGNDPADVALEFGAFVEAAHALNMRVLLDLAPRTASRDSDLIFDHPDWFYWIDRKTERSYGSPHIDGADYAIPRLSDLPGLHARPVMRDHLAKFRFAPNVTAPGKWKQFVKRMRANPPRNLLAGIAREFGVITPPGFSDCVNDPQPPWSDVTFLRYFWDHPAAVSRCLPDPDKQPPYVFSEVIKASVFEGKRPNRELWKTLAGILPFYQKFGVDGARIDMGHALPKGLERMILDTARRHDPDFGLIAEEFGTDHSAKAKRTGYNMLIGSSWYMEPRANEGLFHELLRNVLAGTKLPIWATAETPDTPRAVVRRGGRRFARLAAAVNHFLPNAVPFASSGMEVFERQPMNLGLDIVPPGRYALKKSDPYYGKLAFFDRFVLHWANAGGAAFVKQLGQLAVIRARFVDDLANVGNYFAPRITMNRKTVLAIGFRVQRGARRLLVVANTDYRNARRTVVSGLPGGRGRRFEPELLFEAGGAVAVPKVRAGKLSLHLAPGGVGVLLL